MWSGFRGRAEGGAGYRHAVSVVSRHGAPAEPDSSVLLLAIIGPLAVSRSGSLTRLLPARVFKPA